METPISSFSGHVYGNGSNSTSGSNTVRSYKAGNGKPKKKKKNKSSNPKKKIDVKSIAVTRATPSVFASDGRSPDYSETNKRYL